MFKRYSIRSFTLTSIFFILLAIAQNIIEDCVMQHYVNADASLTLADVRKRCNVENVTEEDVKIGSLVLLPTMTPHLVQYPDVSLKKGKLSLSLMFLQHTKLIISCQ